MALSFHVRHMVRLLHNYCGIQKIFLVSSDFGCRALGRFETKETKKHDAVGVAAFA